MPRNPTELDNELDAKVKAHRLREAVRTYIVRMRHVEPFDAEVMLSDWTDSEVESYANTHGITYKRNPEGQIELRMDPAREVPDTDRLLADFNRSHGN